ncbi:hypothetical protein DW046_07560, partial [Bacteroides stercoris]
VFILPLHLDYTKVIILILWWRNFQLEYWRTFQLVSTLCVKIIQRILRTTENAVQMQIYAGIYTCCLAVIIQHNIQLDKCTRVFT